jgi:undecaprenyl-diphosphatase
MTSFRFSFLASIPAVLGAAILEADKIKLLTKVDVKNFTWGFIFSFIVGIFSLWLLKRIINKAKLYYFGYYCIFVALITLLFIR